MIKLSAITKEYKQGNHSFKALSDINLEIQKGELVLLSARQVRANLRCCTLSAY